MIIGQEKPDAGSVKIGETVQLAYVDQSRTLDPEKTVYEEISGGADTLELGKRKINAVAMCPRSTLRPGPAEESWHSLRGGTQPRPFSQDPHRRRKCLTAR